MAMSPAEWRAAADGPYSVFAYTDQVDALLARDRERRDGRGHGGFAALDSQ